ncbi:uncharacterized protein LOC131335693 [Rhododendron vialii]|uniref:uncharacterized protein LOC131335693 n=1 Tax=Rhododendron vialii TaxID=182163 RepID=UPI00265F4C44|nr:uncharacterized protein LOC131335693 [Rhododendron vialii]
MRARGNLSDEDYQQPEDAPEDEDNDDDTFSYTDDEELDKFNIVGYDEKEHVRHGIDRKCKKLYKTWRHIMKDHYEALVEAGKDPYVNPYKGVSSEDWAWMIGNIWTNKDKELVHIVAAVLLLFFVMAIGLAH